MIVELHEEASAELGDAAEWYESQREGLGRAFVHEVKAAAVKIGEFPTSWSWWPKHPEIRVVRVRRFPYHLPYVLRDVRAIILAIAHGRRRRGYWLDDRVL